MKILVLGGAGYIGSHTMVELLNKNHEVVCIDNLSNSSLEAVKRVEKITGKTVSFYKLDLLDREKFLNIFCDENKKNKIDVVIMMAGFKAVGESVDKPLEYYENNLLSLINTLYVMKKYDCNNIIFSSSATVYGRPKSTPIYENFNSSDITNVSNPYGRTKAIIERIIMDYAISNENFKAVILRYFNPVGAHESGLIGEDPKGIPNNLMPFISQVAVGKRDTLHIFGNDYDTKDGTGVRDYIHVVDLAIGHVKALKVFDKNFVSKYENEIKNVYVYNLGTGNGYSVLDIVKAYEKACGHKINYDFKDRRKGDLDTVFCDKEKAYIDLGFEAKYNIDDMCTSSYNFQKNNPMGYIE